MCVYPRIGINLMDNFLMNKLTNTQNALDIKNDQKVGGVRSAVTHLIKKIINKNNSIKEHIAGEHTANKSIKTKVLDHTQDAANEPFFQLVNGDLGDIHSTPWLIESWVTEKSLVCTYAPSASLKSFLVLDQSLHICSGTTWNGFPVKKGVVLYIAGEGRNGMIKRVAAWCNYHNQKALENFYLSNTAIELLDNTNVDRVIEEAKSIIEQHGEIGMIVIDTLNRNFGTGDENKTKDMTTFISAVSRLQSQVNSCVHIVHHTSKADSTLARGSGALRAALDCEFMIDAERDRQDKVKAITLSCKKMKDDDLPEPIKFVPKSVNLEVTDINGKSLDSLVLDSQDSQYEMAQKSLIKHLNLCIRDYSNFSEEKFKLMVFLLNRILQSMIEPDLPQEIVFKSSELVSAHFGNDELSPNKKSRFFLYLDKVNFLTCEEKNGDKCFVFKFKTEQGEFSEEFILIREKSFSQHIHLERLVRSNFLNSISSKDLK